MRPASSAPGRQRYVAHGLPAAMSAATAWAMSLQPAACQVSNGPGPSRSPSAWRDRGHGRCRQPVRAGRRNNGKRPGRWTRGSAPEDAVTPAGARISPPDAWFSRWRQPLRQRRRRKPGNPGFHRSSTWISPALLAEDAAARLLPQGAFLDQRPQPGRHGEMAVPGIVGKGVLHGLDHVARVSRPTTSAVR